MLSLEGVGRSAAPVRVGDHPMTRGAQDEKQRSDLEWIGHVASVLVSATKQSSAGCGDGGRMCVTYPRDAAGVRHLSYKLGSALDGGELT